jgi:phasin
LPDVAPKEPLVGKKRAWRRLFIIAQMQRTIYVASHNRIGHIMPARRQGVGARAWFFAAKRFAVRRGRRLSKGGNSMTNPTYQIPTEVREFAEKSVEQARKAFEGFSGAAQKAIAAVDTSAIPAAAGVKEVGATALGYAEANVKAAFDLATKLVQAKDVQEVLTLQTEFAKKQFEAFQEQTKELGAAFTKAASPK